MAQHPPVCSSSAWKTNRLTPACCKYRQTIAIIQYANKWELEKNKDFQATSLFSSICIMQQLGCKSKQNQYVRSILCRPTPTSITQQQHRQLPPRAIGNGRCNGIHIWWAVVISVALLPARTLHICHNHHNRWLCKKIQSSVKFSNGYVKETALILQAQNV